MKINEKRGRVSIETMRRLPRLNGARVKCVFRRSATLRSFRFFEEKEKREMEKRNQGEIGRERERDGEGGETK